MITQKDFSGKNNLLTEQDYANLASRWIDKETIEREGIYRVNSVEGKELVGGGGYRDFSGIIFNAFWPGEAKPREVRLRRDHPEIKNGKPDRKYLTPPGRGNILWFTSRALPADLHNIQLPIIIVEGNGKLLAVDRLSYHETKEPKFLVIGVAGVWGWRGTVGKTFDSLGSRVAEKGVIGDFDRITWAGRTVIILFDANVFENPGVQAARRELGVELEKRGASIFSLDIPPEEGINGPDDYLAKHGPEAFLELTRNTYKFNPNFHLSELGNAERFIYRHGHNIKYVPGKDWMIWDKARWACDSTFIVDKAMQETARAIYSEINDVPGADTDRRERIVSWAIKSESYKILSNSIFLAKTKLAYKADDMDKNPMHFNCANGTINLEDATLREHTRTDMLSKISNIPYDPSAKCPLWLSFLNKIMASNQNLINFLQKAMGYSLTGSTEEQVLFILHGNGQNGKSVFLETLHAIMGEYAINARSETLMQKRNETGDGANNDVAALCGMRLVSCSETESNRKLKESLVKDLTGGDTITARFLHKEFFNFKPQFKIWMRANHLPTITGTDDGIWRRIRKIPFEVKIQDHEKDTKLFEKLKEEFPGILAWAVVGALKWKMEGLGEPEEIKKAGLEYRADSDAIGRFLDEKCQPEEGWRVKSGDVYKLFIEWCKENGEYELSVVKFGKAINERGYKKVTVTAGVFYLGLKVKD